MKLFNKFSDLIFKFYLKRSLFAHFLSRNEQINKNNIVICYQALSMYKSVLSIPIQKQNPYAFIAYITAKAACGIKDKESDFLIKEFVSSHPNFITPLIIQLAPYEYSQALELCEQHQIKIPLTVALLLQNKKIEQARKVLSSIQRAQYPNKTDLLLLEASISFNEPKKVLYYINQIYSNNNLVAVQLNDINNSLNVNNLTTENIPHCNYLMNKKITIIITTFNCENYISSTLTSLINQSYRNLEILIIDDCSTDNTLDILKNFQRLDTRIKVFNQPINSGTYLAKNRALSLATGDFIVCHDADDWSHPQRFEVQIQPLLKDKHLIATTSNWFRLDNQGKIHTRSIYPIARLNPSSILFRRNIVLKKMGYWDSVRTGADSEFLARLKLVFGQSAIQKIKIPLTIGAYRTDSLMYASDTGFTSSHIPSSRLDYWEAWNSWHIETLKHKNSFYLPPIIPSSQRPFPIPKQIAIDENSIEKLKINFNI